MHPTRSRIVGVVAGAGLAATMLTGPPPATAGHDHGPRVVRVHAAPTPRHWDPLIDAKWAFERGQVVLTEPGEAPPGPRRPFEYAIVTKGPELSSVRISAQVRIDEPVEVDNRDVIIVWNYRSPTRFYYAHLSQDNTIYPHNGIFVVDDADRRRIDDQWDGAVGAPPAIDDTDWHDVRLDYDARTGAIAVHVDGADEPLMTATDTTFSGGRVGFGSFDNHGRTRHFSVVGTAR
ncbi:hypothetical protein [Nocardioides sp. TF02-7]|uniref:hypothetical protein n=1 Tax=Nocardioides sp. TF02-7 TaxID=2917724 RepID=UPI001F0642DC|nr:hypothetical protein [Nocardioides sp. TF02-7]UMG93628.1 hypothetical protein MF408_05405 [Nocardioides sp. TF02-7]